MTRIFRIIAAALFALITPVIVRAQADVRAGDIILRYWSGQEALARSVLPDPRNASFAGLPADILARGVPIIIYLAPDELRFDSLTGGRAPEWGAGVADPLAGVIVVPGYVSERSGTHELPQILRHELAHVALQRHLGNARVPRWFTEGYATWVAGELDDNGGWQLRAALATSRAPALDSITLDWPRGEFDARLAYLLSASAVRYLYSLGPPARFEQFLNAWAKSGSLEPALREVYVVSTPQLEQLWIAHVKKRYGWLQVIAQSALGWAALMLIMAVLFVVRKRRDRRRMAQLRHNEPPEQPAYWNETDEENPPETDEQSRQT